MTCAGSAWNWPRSCAATCSTTVCPACTSTRSTGRPRPARSTPTWVWCRHRPVELMELPVRARLVVVSAAVRAAFCWAVLAAALTAPIYVGFSVHRVVLAAVVFLVVWLLITLAVFVLPVARYGEWVARRLIAGEAPARLSNVAAGLALAIGVPEGR